MMTHSSFWSSVSILAAADFLQELQRKALRLVDNQNRRLAAAVAVAQKRLEFDQHRRL